MRSFIYVAAAAALLLASFEARAANWSLEPSASRLGFTYYEDGQPVSGAFLEFDGDAALDPANMTDASVRVQVKTESIELSDGLRTHFAQSVDWFDVEQHPAAVFELSRMEEIGEGRYRAEGKLTIKDRTVAIAPLVVIDETGGRLVADGEVRFPRSAFGLGIGFSSLFVEVGDEVVVDFRLVGRRVN